MGLMLSVDLCCGVAGCENVSLTGRYTYIGFGETLSCSESRNPECSMPGEFQKQKLSLIVFQENVHYYVKVTLLHVSPTHFDSNIQSFAATKEKHVNVRACCDIDVESLQFINQRMHI